MTAAELAEKHRKAAQRISQEWCVSGGAVVAKAAAPENVQHAYERHKSMTAVFEREITYPLGDDGRLCFHCGCYGVKDWDKDGFGKCVRCDQKGMFRQCR